MPTTSTARAAHRALQKEAERANGRLVLNRRDYETQSEVLFGRRRVLPPQQMLAMITPSTNPTVAPMRRLQSQLTAVGDAPDGYGKDLIWDPADEQLAAVIFVNPAEMTGVRIHGVRASDTIQIVKAEGVATFSVNAVNDLFSSFLGVVGDAIDSFDLPFVEPLIQRGIKFAQEKFKAMGKTKPRDPYGREPNHGPRARQEGGVIVSLPGDDGNTPLFTSGKDEKLWIKKPGLRDPENYPAHVRQEEGFFLRGGSRPDRATARHDGDIVIRAWDHIFDDNFGFYRLNVLLKRAA